MNKFLQLTVLVFVATAGGFLMAADDSGRMAFFESNIRPVLVKNCYECHGDGSKKGSERLLDEVPSRYACVGARALVTLPARLSRRSRRASPWRGLRRPHVALLPETAAPVPEGVLC